MAKAVYTVVNLKQVEDMAPKFGLSPGLESRFAAFRSSSRSRVSATSASPRTSGRPSDTLTASRRRSTLW